MRIELRTAGGFAPALMGQAFAVDAANLPEDVQQQLTDLAEEALREPSPEPNPQLRDARSHEITITQPGRKETIVAFDGAMPPAVGRLIKLVKSLATKS